MFIGCLSVVISFLCFSGLKYSNPESAKANTEIWSIHRGSSYCVEQCKRRRRLVEARCTIRVQHFRLQRFVQSEVQLASSSESQARKGNKTFVPCHDAGARSSGHFRVELIITNKNPVTV